MTDLIGRISHEKPPRRVNAGGTAETYTGGSDMVDSTCSVDGCEDPAKARGWCNTHYERWRRSGREPVKNRLYYQNDGFCRHPGGCLKPAIAKGWCRRHYRRVHETGDPGPVESLRPGGWQKRADGYIGRWSSEAGKNEMQHRWVMEQHLGRSLEDFETVHHLNGIRHDNRLANLELWVKPQPAGRRAYDLADWVVRTYPGLVSERFQLSLFDSDQVAPTT